MQYTGRLNRYLHQAVQVFFFDADELKILLILFIVANVFGGYVWLLFLFGPMILIPYKREQQRGFYRHIQVHVGLATLWGYPTTEAHYFYE